MRALPIVALLGALAACSGGGEDVASAGDDLTANTVFTPEALRLWTAHVDKAAEVPLQTNCFPTRYAPPHGTRSRGVVVLFHGFTACPQQYYDSGRRLANEGWDVLLPLLPGEGRYWTKDAKGNVLDRLDGMPGTDDWQRYQAAAAEMNAIAAAVKGERVVAGLSVGGAVATEAVLAAPTLWTRALVMSPFYDTSSGFARLIVPIADAIVPDNRMSWGASCEAERTERAGICQFTIDQLQAARRFGGATLDRLKQASAITAKVQLAGVEDDQAAFDDDVRRAATTMPAKDLSLCFFEKGTNHSFLSRYDEATENKFWLPEAEDQMVDFIANGTPFATVGASLEPASQRCKTRT